MRAVKFRDIEQEKLDYEEDLAGNSIGIVTLVHSYICRPGPVPPADSQPIRRRPPEEPQRLCPAGEDHPARADDETEACNPGRGRALYGTGICCREGSK